MAVLAIGSLSLLCLILGVALLAALDDGPSPEIPADPEPVAVGAAPALPQTEPDADAASSDAEPQVTRFPAEAASIPVELIARLEQSSDAPLEAELSHLLDAIHHGFDRESAQLEPTLRSYVYRMASRFTWNPDSFRVGVTAPDPDLAAARATLLERLFPDAVEAGHLAIETGTGPHALTVLPD